MFIRKRDPRYKSHLAQQARLNQTKSNDSLAPSGSKPLPRRAQAKNTPYVEQEWQKVTKDHQHDDLEWAAAEGEDPEEWECVACGKSFKSEAAWDSHERSKKHMKEVERLKREVIRENEELGLSGRSWDDDDERRYIVEVDGNAGSQPPPTPPSRAQGDESDTISERLSKTIDVPEDEFASEESSEQPQVGQTTVCIDKEPDAQAQPPEVVPAPRELSKREKRRLREARKAQAAETERSIAQVSNFVYRRLLPNRATGLQCLQRTF